ncbi:MAG: prepilin-type N-terminal cleavage/methylation domain-containing protein [Pseudomonadota bacterium]
MMPSDRRSSTPEKGVTLIELLVGLAIFSVAAGVAVMTAAPKRPPVQEAAEQFYNRLNLAVDDAILGGTPVRLEWTEDTYRFLRPTRQTVDAGSAWAVSSSWSPEGTGVVFSMTKSGGAADNALALNGGTSNQTFVGFNTSFGTPTENEPSAPNTIKDGRLTRDVEVFIVDPLSSGQRLTASFQSSRAIWTVSLLDDGAISLSRL